MIWGSYGLGVSCKQSALDWSLEGIMLPLGCLCTELGEVARHGLVPKSGRSARSSRVRPNHGRGAIVMFGSGLITQLLLSHLQRFLQADRRLTTCNQNGARKWQDW